jgi:uncharacterized protein (TIGR02444 family)
LRFIRFTKVARIEMSSDNFWSFSVTLYSKPGVANACLALQNDHDLDVNLVLFCIWYGQNHGELSSSQLDELLDFSLLWATHVVKPLRQARRWIKQNRDDCEIPAERLESFRDRVKKLELEAEQLQQNRLQQLAQAGDNSDQGGSSTAAETNLDRYLQCMGIGKSDSVARQLAVISGAH